MLLGDVWAVIATITGIAVCSWALLVFVSFLFSRRTHAAKELIVSSPFKMIGLGLLATVLIGGGGIVLLNVAFPLAKTLGTLMLLGIMAVSFAGSAGLVQIVGERIHQLDPRLSSYAALSRGSMFLVLSSILPLLGWFLFAPIIFCLGVGAGLRVLRLKETVPPVVVM